ncbi:Gfo/Idh/MocA family protein [Montanilutibacter psychrotolerans]|uniref:Gfo/Idh/MocA family oxidoreductase n=1 Tax=Montanilutibacter psychrotolerans TaxID=1327343 RepID=A0A3M8SNI4_9GAMM|nr:Gfo/Idh/MocA family oxidoreductase [Lysobacter psychrotolerans]RNF82891.1 gfo/Idh/MocA family oxidoreductase [Lysobacter psychrotolerans]
MKRRDFLSAAAAGAALSLPLPGLGRGAKTRLRVAVIGTGMRGQVLLRELLRRDDVELAAICDIEAFMLERALAQVDAAGKPRPQVHTGSDDAWRGMLAKGGIDAVIIATPWELHAPMAIAAMQAKVAVGCEVVAGITLDDHWQVLRTQEQTGTPYMLLENVCYRRDVLAVLGMVRQGLFGELVHVQGGYEHDLRAVKFNSGEPGKATGGGVEFGEQGWSEARWRTAHSVRRNGELYPSHGIGPCAMWLDIHRGNRFTRLTSYASNARGLHDYVVDNAGAGHPNAQVRFALGDVVTTQIACENGQTIVLTHDTSLPRPYSLGFRVQGTEGLWMDVNKSLYIEGKSPQPHQWEPAQPWLDRHDHPLWQRHGAQAAGAGHGGMDFFVVHAFIEALKRGAPMPIDIYDAVAWSAITPLSEQSIAAGNQTVAFPDFSQGRWKDRQRIFALDGQY